MKAKLLLHLSLAVLILVSCDRMKPTASAPTPEPRSAPSGKLYVIKRFSVTTSDGLHGFSPGKLVTLIREDLDSYVVTDGIVEGKASKDSFSVNPDIAKAVGDKHQQLQQSAQQRLNEQSRLAKLQEAVSVQQAKADDENKKIAQRKQQISDIQIQLDDLSQRISKARAERSSKGFPQDGGSRRYHGYYHGDTVSLSTDATQIETLLSAKAALESQLRNLNRN